MKKDKIIRLLNIPLTSTTPSTIVSDIAKIIKTPGKKTIFYANAHNINIALQDPEYKEILTTADFLFPDGIGVAWAAKILNKPIPKKITLMDFVNELLEEIIKNEWTLCLIGGSDEVCRNTIKNFKKDFPGIKIAGFYNGYFNDAEEEKIIKQLNIKKPDIIFVAMGVPKQEKWIIKNMSRIHARAFFAIGGSIDHLGGVIPRAPAFMHQNGFEWLYRFLKEPKRLWRRYLIGNPVFLYRVLKSKIKSN